MTKSNVTATAICQKCKKSIRVHINKRNQDYTYHKGRPICLQCEEKRKNVRRTKGKQDKEVLSESSFRWIEED